MCNGQSTRISQGGSIAVLRPTQHLQRCQSDKDMLLYFNNHCGTRGTSIEFEGWNDEEQRRDGQWLVIDHDGGFAASPSRAHCNPLYSFSLDSSRQRQQPMHLPQRLEPGVSDVGIIGRRVSVMNSSTSGPLTVAEVIIGWN
ncbi:hypothetical protein EK21DRAFT_102867 [Setomelanomma holmii]|uniref:Uncharacterized protein n=1 Tax=Setomelanomma holmii TaxID=210430 RepID=A0A9P4H3R0_9PLEO|nr:hypothetical protein EK21DRAFT_102867 [Setomelanomma holmii]